MVVEIEPGQRRDRYPHFAWLVSATHLWRERSRRAMNDGQRTGLATGGQVPDPAARAGTPLANRLQPLPPDTRNR